MTDTLPRYFYDVLANAAQRWPDQESFRRRVGDKLVGRTYKEMKRCSDELAAGLIDLGVQVGDRVTFLCDASHNWFLTDVAIVASGGVSTPRGTDVTDDDIIYIVSHSESKYALVQREKDRKRLEGLRSNFPALQQIFVIETEEGELATGPATVGELMEKGRAALQNDAEIVRKRVNQTDPKAMATLIYTSGTTGAPKGVMLNQHGLLSGIQRVLERLNFQQSDRVVSLLPPWHIFERANEYGVAWTGIDFLISNINVLKKDLAEFKPTILPSVPRIWESVYNGIIGNVKKASPAQQKIFNFFLNAGTAWARHRSILGGYDLQVEKPFFLVSFVRRLWSLIVLILMSPLKGLSKVIFKKIHQAVGGELRISVSGGSALPAVVDRFLQAIGIPVMEGYGMTETSAIISVREFSRPTSGTVGRPIPGYSIKLKDETGKDVKDVPGQKGTLWVKSDQILMGYYKRPELNDVVFDEDGHFDTGDIMKLSWRGELMFAGRAKDTIALGGGENVEPVPIEDKLLESEFIDQVMVVGDDKKTLGAIIVPNFERVQSEVSGLSEDAKSWNGNKDVRALYKKEITRLISKDTGFKTFEVVPGNCFYISGRPFEANIEMTQTLKMKRPVIKENFASEIDAMYEK